MGSTKRLSLLDADNKRIQNAAPATLNTDVAQWGQTQTAISTAQSAAQTYADTAVAGLVSGQTLKGKVRAAVATAVTLTAPGSSLDGLTPAAGEVYLLTAQATGSENGPWVYNGSAAAMTRPSNFDTAGKAVVGSYWVVNEGSKADTFALLTNDAFTLGTTVAAFKFVDAAAASTIAGYSETNPTTAASGTWTATHNLNSRKLQVTVSRASTPWDEVEVAITKPTLNTVAILPDVALAAGEYEVVITKGA